MDYREEAEREMWDAANPNERTIYRKRGRRHWKTQVAYRGEDKVTAHNTTADRGEDPHDHIGCSGCIADNYPIG